MSEGDWVDFAMATIEGGKEDSFSSDITLKG